MNNNQPALSFDDVVLLPSCSTKKLSRNDVNLFVTYDNLPIMNAPMSSVITKDNYMEFYNACVFTCLPFSLVKEVDITLLLENSNRLFSIAVRYNEVDEYLKYSVNGQLITNFENIVVILDIANGHDLYRVFDAMERLEASYHSPIMFCMGNVANEVPWRKLKALHDASTSGARGQVIRSAMIPGWVRAGIGCGGTCLTTQNTGIGLPTLASVMLCRPSMPKDVMLIADGGMRTPGDVCKALRLGADFAMLGSYFAGTVNSPSTLYGEASATAKGYNRFVEGAELPVQQTKDTIAERVQRLADGIASMLTYCGLDNIHNVHDHFERNEQVYATVTANAQHQWSAHAIGRV